MKITLKDGSSKIYDEKKSIIDIAKDISEGLARMACAAELNGKVVDLRTVVEADCELNILTFNDEAGKSAYRHTTSHILAQAVKRLYPEAKLAIGPSIEAGFYYDFDIPSLTRENLDALESEMKKIVKEGADLVYITLPKEEAIQLMTQKEEPYKVELIQDLPDDAIISFYSQGDFTDLCAGPHLMSTKNVKAFKLTSSSGAYWRGSEKNKMLTRVYGTAFTKNAELEEYLVQLEEAKKRDHNKLGREMEIFTTVDVIGQGLPLLMPNGARIVQTLQRWIEDEEEKRGYMLTKTPLMAKRELYKISGHWDHYRDGMFVIGDKDAPADQEVLALRPMTCPFQYFIYKASPKSYRDLPCRYGETSTLFRNEESGEMHGLIRVRQFTISEAHLIVMPEQVEEEFKGVMDLVNYTMSTLGIDEDVTYRFSKWDPKNREKYIGTDEEWENAQSVMKTILDHMGLDYTEAEGEAAFYGPKLDIQTKNVHGKEDTIITIQLDFALAEKYDMSYIDKNGEKKRPYIIHRTSIGCYERTLAILIEKYAGQFPTWICPEQVRVLPISEKYSDYANQVIKELKSKGVKCTVDHRAEKIGYKIRESRLARVPYLLVVGENEEGSGSVSVRSRYNGDEGQKPLALFVEELSKEISSKEIKKIKVVENQ